MEELNKTNRLTITVVVIVLVIITGLITLRKPEIKYTLSPAESLVLLNDPALLVTPTQAAALLKDSAGNTVFIDVRNSLAFDRGHLKNAVNIPVHELFSKKYKAVFHDIEKAGQTAVLYGETQQQANGPWLMLQQTGYKNVRLFTGCYAQINSYSDSLVQLLPQFSETPGIDTVALRIISSPAAAAKDAVSGAKQEKKSVKPVKKEASSGGGC